MRTRRNDTEDGKMKKVVGLAAVIVILGTIGAAPVSASAPNTVLAWNEQAIDALVNAPSAPTPGAGRAPNVVQVDLAMVQGAVYDAVNSIDGRHEPLIDSVPPAPPSASMDAAAATAAHHVLAA